jgi:pimeloyl-ACP methyl ester carboxylesterase
VPSTAKPLIVFSHGNSFPASTYGAMLGHLISRGYDVRAIEKIGHDAAYPVTNNWPHLVTQLADFTHRQVLHRPDQPLFLVGHSLGGFLSLMCAAKHPELGGNPVRGVILLDSPVIGGWRAKALRAAKRWGVIGSVSPGSISQKRKNVWPDAHAAFLHFRTKKNFMAWDDEAIHSYVENFKTHPQGHRHLGFDRDIETAIYNTLPDNMQAHLSSHPPQCPVAFVGGLESVEVKRVGLHLTRKLTQERLRMVSGSHLFPIENPLVAAAAIDAEILNIAALT